MSFNVLDDRVFKYFVHKLCGLASIERTYFASREREREARRQRERAKTAKNEKKIDSQTGRKRKGSPLFEQPRQPRERK